MLSLRPRVELSIPVAAKHVPSGGELRNVRRAVGENRTVVVFSLTDSAYHALGERLGQGNGGAALREAFEKLGVDEVFRTDCCWDDLAHAEARELLSRMNDGLPLPLLLYACPVWARAVREARPDCAPFFSGASLNAQRQGIAARARVAVRRGVAPERIAHVTVVGCPARKAALLAGGMDACVCGGEEHVLTVREVLSWLVEEGVAAPGSPKTAASAAGRRGPDSRLHDVLAHAWLIENGALPPSGFLRLEPCLELAGVTQGEVELGGKTIRAAKVRGVENAYALLSRVREGSARFDLVEALSCASGCV